MTTEPTAKHQEEARERIKVCIRPGKEDWIGVAYAPDANDPSKIHEYVPASALSSHNTQIREVLEGLRFRHGCWCELPPNITSPDHTCECDAARELWNRVNLTEPTDSC